MSISTHIKDSNIIELIEESTNEDETAFKALLRVTDSDAWSPLMVSLLYAAEDTEYVLSIRKEYYISEESGQPTYVWVLLLWGDLEEGFSDIGPLLEKTAASPKPKQTSVKAAPPKKTNTRSYRTEDGVRQVTTVKLPFRRGRRDDPGVTKSLSSRRGVGAYVSTVTDGGL